MTTARQQAHGAYVFTDIVKEYNELLHLYTKS